MEDVLKSFLQGRRNVAIMGGLIAMSCLGILVVRRLKKRKKEIIVFTRYPVPGKTKTRMIPALGAVGAANLQRCMTEHIVEELGRFGSVDTDLDITIQYNGGTADMMEYWLKRLTRHPVSYKLQTGSDLGNKLTNAVKDSFSSSHQYVVIIGGDVPGINVSVLQEAYLALQSGSDMVLGPAEDGGYYLVGFHRKAQTYIDRIFSDIEWGTSAVFQQQVNQANSCGAKLTVLQTVLRDVDTEEDLEVVERFTGQSQQQLQSSQWSIVMPVLNEEKNIVQTIDNLVKGCSDCSRLVEIVISDGGSTDATVRLVKEVAATTSVPVKVVHSKPGRGNQLIAGAAAATGEYLLFVHADTLLPPEYDKLASDCLSVPGNVAGAFPFQVDVLQDESMRIQEPWWFILQMTALVWGTRLRGRKKELPYGDQGLFVSRRVYDAVGGYPDFYLMEDFILVERLQTRGHVAITAGEPAVTSARRWRRHGYFRITGWNSVLVLAYRLGVHPNTLARWYYGKKLKTE